MCDFKKRVLVPAIKDINKNSDITVTWTQRKTGRKVTHIKFQFHLKETEKAENKYEPKIIGIRKSVIEKKARPGESYEQAAARMKNEKKVKS